MTKHSASGSLATLFHKQLFELMNRVDNRDRGRETSGAVVADIPRPVVLVSVQYFLPGYKSGGPIRSIQAMTELLGEEVDFRVIAYDRDAGDNEAYPDCGTSDWETFPKCRVHYIEKGRWKWLAIARIVYQTPADTLYLQSLFHPLFTLLPVLLFRAGLTGSRRCVIAPRGELSAGALSIHRRRKSLFLAVARRLRFFRGCHWHATSVKEAAEIRSCFRLSAFVTKTHVSVARNLVPVNAGFTSERSGDTTVRTDAPGEGMRVVFLSRIAPKKNLDFAIDVLSNCSSRIHFSIYGPIDREPAFWELCESKLVELPPNIQAKYEGVVHPDRVADLFRRSDLFFFPTRGENFGHVIAESLLSGCPVLVSDQTPWRELEKAGVGWDLPLSDAAKFVSVIDQVAAMTLEDRVAQRRRAVQFARERVNTADEIARNRAFLSRV